MSAARSYLLFELRPAQLGMKDERILDRDADGEGEFGTLEDLVRASEKVGAMKLWERPSEFRAELDEGRIAWGSYLLKVYVPKDVDEREQMWCAAVWPALYKRGGRYSLVYWVNPMFPAGKLARTEDSRYSGWGKGPRLDEIFEGEPFQSEVRRDVWETY